MDEYKYILSILNLEYINSDGLLFYSQNSKKITYDNKQIVFVYSFSHPNNKQTQIEFHPLNEKEKSCSYLLMDDSIHLYLKNLTYNLFNKIFDKKDDTSTHPAHKFDMTQIDALPNPAKYTRHKFNNLFNIVSATSFSKNLITFSIDLNSTRNHIEIDFKYPLYDELCTIQNNTLFGIYLEDFEVELFKKIYEYYIIDIVDNLFKDPIEISENSRKHPSSYALLTMKLKLEEAFSKKYNISFMRNIKIKLTKYDEVLANLNQFTYMLPSISQEQQELDLQSYENELEIRKASESNWLKLKDKKMQAIVKREQTEIVSSRDEEIEIFMQHIAETADKKYIRQINNFLTDQRVNDYIQNYNQFKNNQEWAEIFHWQNLVLNILNGNGASLWFDTRTGKYYFRSKAGGEIVDKNIKEISELLTRALKEKITSYLNSFNNGFIANHAIEIVLVQKLNGIQSQNLKQSERASNVIKILLFENEIPTIDDDKFDVYSSSEFSKDDEHFFYTRNRFVPTKHLLKRFNNTNLTSNNAINFDSLFAFNEDSYLLETIENTSNYKRSSFIEDFIFYLVDEDIAAYYYVMNWLSCFFNSLEKSGTALVLIGDQELTENILLDKIIKEIFGLQYCITINDEECESPSAFDIAKDKLFFHIGDINNPATKFDDETLHKLVKDLLVKKSVTRLNEEDKQEESIVHGQMIITAKNPSPYIKKAISKCTIIKVNDMDTIIEKLGVPDELILEDKIEKDLDNFSDILQSFKGNYEFAKYAMDTRERQEISGNKTSNINKEDVEKDIDDFIQAIKDKNIEYFEKVKEVEDGAIYERLKNAFNYEDGYFIGQDLLHYYNATHEQKFENKKQLTDKVKEKDAMFAQEVKTLKILTVEQKEEVLFKSYKTSKDTNHKELYKINGYTLAKDITIPYGTIIVTSQVNIKKYNHSNLENAIKIHKEYQENKTKKD